MLVIVNGALPVFESVTAWAGLVVLTCWLPKGTEEGVRVTVGTVPVPERLTVCGLPVALSLKVRPALRLPAAVGVNVTLMVQLVLAASVEGLMGQLFVWPKSPGFVPPRAMLVIVNGALPVFESVTAWAGLVVLTSWLPKGTDEGVSVAPGEPPVPVRLAV